MTTLTPELTTTDPFEDLSSRMMEVKVHIEIARCYPFSAMTEIQAPLTSSLFEAVALANDCLGFALTAWDE